MIDGSALLGDTGEQGSGLGRARGGSGAASDLSLVEAVQIAGRMNKDAEDTSMRGLLHG